MVLGVVGAKCSPACAVRKIRDKFPSDNYTGFNYPTLDWSWVLWKSTFVFYYCFIFNRSLQATAKWWWRSNYFYFFPSLHDIPKFGIEVIHNMITLNSYTATHTQTYHRYTFQEFFEQYSLQICTWEMKQSIFFLLSWSLHDLSCCFHCSAALLDVACRHTIRGHIYSAALLVYTVL